MKNSTTIEMILFDLGGVLVDWDGFGPLVALTDGRLSHDEAKHYWFTSNLIRDFETGRCTAEQFAAGIITELSLSLSPSEFLQQFINWDHGIYPGGIELLHSLKQRYIMACLTNNNEFHIRRMREDQGLDGLFHFWFVSSQMGVMKPAKAAFNTVLTTSGLSPEKILYFDDSPANIDAAKNMGFLAHQVFGIDQVKVVLRQLNISV